MLTKAKEIMSSPVITVQASASLDDVIELLLKHQVSGLPVVDERDHLVGVITELDLLKLLYGKLQTDNTRVANYLTRPAVTINEDDSVIDVAGVFMNHSIRRVPVLRGEKVVGVISRRDMIRYIRDVRSMVSQELNRPAKAGT